MKMWWGYFSRPFPSRQGFSAYRFPGIIVHLPIMVFITVFGFLLCADHTWLLTLIPFYIIIGLYVGRDIAIYARYNLLISLAVAAGIIFQPFYSAIVKEFIAVIAAPLSGLYSFLLSVAIITAFYFYVRHWVIKEKKAEDDEEARATSSLHYAVENGHDKTVELLLQRGAAVNAVTFHKYTPLHYAALHGHLKIAKMLIRAGTDINSQTADGHTALTLAEAFGHKKVADLLIPFINQR